MIDIDSVPPNFGCYFFKDDENGILYVGKAKNLKKRVKSYFQKNDLDTKTESLVRCIDSVDYIVTDNEVEALILENTLIKRHQPKYNIDLKDSKRYAYIHITDEAFSRLLIARKRTGRGWYYGPFVSGQERDYVLSFLNKTFRLRTCRRMPKKPCLRYHIKLCEAPCAGHISNEDYVKGVEKARTVLKGKVKELIKELAEEMNIHSDSRRYENAIDYRNQIKALENLRERQKVDRQRRGDEDIINYVIKGEKVYLIVFNIYRGMLGNKKEYSFELSQDFLEEFLVQYYSEESIPHELILPQSLNTSLILYLENKRGGHIKTTIAKKGAKKELLDLVATNIEVSFFGDTAKLEHLKKAINIQEIPHIIECFDISHLSGSSTVGSMVQYRDGRADKNNYRRFKIKTVKGIDDTKAIAEVVKRRYRRLIRENSELPNLVIIDGGRGQLGAGLKVLETLGLRIPVIAIAKRFEEIYAPGLKTPLRLDRKDKALRFIQEIRDEAHRFAIKYNRLLRKKELIG